MFYLELKPKSNNKDIYKIGSLPDCRVKFEPLYPKCEISQYINYQRYGHTKSFCFRRRDVSNVQEIIQLLIAHAERNLRTLNARAIIQSTTKTV